MPNENFAPGAGPTGPAGVDGQDAILTTRQLQQLGCVPTIVGLTPTAQTGSGTFHNVTRGSAQVGYRLTTSAPGRTWTGLSSAGIADGECFQFRNDGPTPFTFAHETTSAAFNQFSLPGNRDLVLEAGEHVVFVYDGVGGANGKWRVVTDGDSEGAAGLTAAQTLSLTCIPTVLGLTPLTAAPPTNGSHYPAGEVGYEFTGASDISVYGLQIRPNGTCCQWHNGSTKDVNFVHLSGGATLASQRIALPEASTPGDSYKLKPGSHMVMQYRSVSPAGSIIPNGVWVVTSITEGE